jgi:hypothetical protein
MRKMYLINPEIMRGYILYDGPKTNPNNRKEYDDLGSLVENIPESKKNVEIYLEGFNCEEVRSIRLALSKRLPKAKYEED